MFYRCLLGLVFLLSLLACQSEKEVSFGKAAATISDLNLKIKDSEVLPWLVGIGKKKGVSRGIRLTFELPELEEKDAKRLKEEYGLDSWLIHLERASIGRNEDLGVFYIQVFSNKSGVFRDMQASQSSVNIHYAASAISERLDRMSCPALDHRMKISEVELVSSSHSFKETMTLTQGIGESLGYKPEKLNFSMFKVNGGKSLKGTYRLSLQAYNSQKGEVISSKIRFENALLLKNEERLSLNECLGSSPESQDRSKDSEVKFKFGR